MRCVCSCLRTGASSLSPGALRVLAKAYVQSEPVRCEKDDGCTHDSQPPLLAM